jgi:hypothetical protein
MHQVQRTGKAIEQTFCQLGQQAMELGIVLAETTNGTALGL